MFERRLCDVTGGVDSSRVAHRPRESPYPIIKVSEAVDIVLKHATTQSTCVVSYKGQGHTHNNALCHVVKCIEMYHVSCAVLDKTKTLRCTCVCSFCRCFGLRSGARRLLARAAAAVCGVDQGRLRRARRRRRRTAQSARRLCSRQQGMPKSMLNVLLFRVSRFLGIFTNKA